MDSFVGRRIGIRARHKEPGSLSKSSTLRVVSVDAGFVAEVQDSRCQLLFMRLANQLLRSCNKPRDSIEARMRSLHQPACLLPIAFSVYPAEFTLVQTIAAATRSHTRNRWPPLALRLMSSR